MAIPLANSIALVYRSVGLKNLMHQWFLNVRWRSFITRSRQVCLWDAASSLQEGYGMKESLGLKGGKGILESLRWL